MPVYDVQLKVVGVNGRRFDLHTLTLNLAKAPAHPLPFQKTFTTESDCYDFARSSFQKFEALDPSPRYAICHAQAAPLPTGAPFAVSLWARSRVAGDAWREWVKLDESAEANEVGNVALSGAFSVAENKAEEP